MVDTALTIFAIIAGIGALFAAIIALPKAVKVLWHGIVAVARWLVAAIRAVAVISNLPERLDKLAASSVEKRELILAVDAKLDKHLADTAQGRAEWAEMRGGLHKLLEGQQVVLHEVQHNGGSSIKDDVKKIREGVAGLYATAGEIGTPGRGRTDE